MWIESKDSRVAGEFIALKVEQELLLGKDAAGEWFCLGQYETQEQAQLELDEISRVRYFKPEQECYIIPRKEGY